MNVCFPTLGQLTKIFTSWSNPHPLPAPPPHGVYIDRCIKTRLRAHKSTILLALLASTDFAVGVIIQPCFIAVLVMLIMGEQSGCHVSRVIRFLIGSLLKASLFHLVPISGERYLAIKHPFVYTTMVTEAGLLVASVLVWLLSVIVQITVIMDKSVLTPIIRALFK